MGGFYDEKFVANVTKRLGTTNWRPGFVIIFYVFLESIFGLAQTFVPALGEEIGWRGFLVPQLAKLTSFTKTAVIVGLIWAIWHYPIFLFPGFTNTFATWYGLSCFTVMVVGLSFICTWFRLMTRSLWPGVFLHPSHNLFVQSIFTPLTRDTGRTTYFVDESGVGLAVIVALTALVFWRLRSRLPDRQFVSVDDEAAPSQTKDK